MSRGIIKDRSHSRSDDQRLPSSVIRRIKSIQMLLMDVDGVLTDGGIFYTDSGLEMKRFHIQDGMGIDMAIRSGIKVGIITGRQSGLVSRRANELGMTILKQGYYDKVIALEEILREQQIQETQVGYIGDDLLDLAVLQRVSFRAAPVNAVLAVKRAVDYVCRSSGGQGAVREVVDLILRVRGLTAHLTKDYMNHPAPNVNLKGSSLK